MPDPSTDRPKNRETEYEDLRPRSSGPPRPATEPKGSQAAQKPAGTATDPGSGEDQTHAQPKAPAPKNWP